jgi:HK97 family phage portal protein
MGLFTRTRTRSRDAPHKRGLAQTAADFIRGIDTYDGYAGSGVAVDEMRSMQTSAVYACVKILAETVASLPLHLCKLTTDGNRERATQHPLYECLYGLPNPETTSFIFREAMMTSLLLWGNAYAQIVRDTNGHVKELWHLKPVGMAVSRDAVTRRLRYDYTDDDGRTIAFAPERVFHVKGLSFDGLRGISPIAQAREAVGLALATEEYGAKFFGNGARPSGVLEHPGVVKDPDKLREGWNRVYQGTKNAHKVAILEEGLKYHPIGIAPEDAQFLETRKYQVNEICRIFRVPPHLVGDLDKATFSNIEHQSIEFVQHTIRPWLVRWEQEIARSLLDAGERSLYFARFNVDGLLRGDYAARTQGYATGRQNGWLSPNDIRRMEDMNPIPSEQGGDGYLVNGNMVPANVPAKQEGGEHIGKIGTTDTVGDGVQDTARKGA